MILSILLDDLNHLTGTSSYTNLAIWVFYFKLVSTSKWWGNAPTLVSIG